MEETKCCINCYGCGGAFMKEELQYRPSGRGAYRKSRYFCSICNEKEIKKNTLKVTASRYRNKLPTRPGFFSSNR